MAVKSRLPGTQRSERNMIDGVITLKAASKRDLFRGEKAVTEFLKVNYIAHTGPKSTKKGREWVIQTREGINLVLTQFTNCPLDPHHEGVLRAKVYVVQAKCQAWLDLPLTEMQTEIAKNSRIPLCKIPAAFEDVGTGIYYSPRGRGWYLRKDAHCGTKPKLVY